MKLYSSMFSGTVQFTEQALSTLVVENPALFRRLVETLRDCNLNDEDTLTLVEGDILPINKVGECLSEFVPFNFNTKLVVNELISHLTTTALEHDNYVDTHDILRMLGRKMQEWALELPYPIALNQLSVKALVKAVDPTFEVPEETLAAKVLAYLRLSRELTGKRWFVLVNLRSYLTAAELDTLMVELLADKFTCLLLDSAAGEVLPHERRYIIDKDLCEIGFDNLT